MPKRKKYLKLVIVPLLLVAVLSLLANHLRPVPNPLPPDFKSQVTFQFAYPSSNTYSVIVSTYKYNSDTGVLSFLVTSGQNQIILTEQTLPASYAPPPDQLGKFHTKIGELIVANTLIEGDSTKPGQSAVITTKKTLIVATNGLPLNNQAWIDFFNSFKITR